MRRSEVQGRLHIEGTPYPSMSALGGGDPFAQALAQLVSAKGSVAPLQYQPHADRCFIHSQEAQQPRPPHSYRYRLAALLGFTILWVSHTTSSVRKIPR